MAFAPEHKMLDVVGVSSFWVPDVEDELFGQEPVLFFDDPPRMYFTLIFAISVELIDACFSLMVSRVLLPSSTVRGAVMLVMHIFS